MNGSLLYDKTVRETILDKKVQRAKEDHEKFKLNSEKVKKFNDFMDYCFNAVITVLL